MKYGCLARFFNLFQQEVMFAKSNNFDIMQLWYDSNGIILKLDENPVEAVLEQDFPTIIHAVLDINEFKEHIPKIIEHMVYLNHSELIIHPVCQSESITERTLYKLIEEVKKANIEFKKNGFKVYIENNSKVDPLLATPEEVEIFFEEIPDIGFLLDIAHVDTLDDLRKIINIKYPDVLHIADRRYSEVHEHLPLGEGEIDYKYIFSNILNDFEGTIIFEVLDDDAVIQAKAKVKEYLTSRS